MDVLEYLGIDEPMATTGEDDAPVIMPFGKHKGTPVSQVPIRYLQWLFENVPLRGKLKTAVCKRVASVKNG